MTLGGSRFYKHFQGVFSSLLHEEGHGTETSMDPEVGLLHILLSTLLSLLLSSYNPNHIAESFSSILNRAC
jgi:hypothetical protein